MKQSAAPNQALSKTALITPLFQTKPQISTRYFSQTNKRRQFSQNQSSAKEGQRSRFYQPLEKSIERQLEMILLRQLQDKPISQLKTEFMSIPKLYDSRNRYPAPEGSTDYLSGLRQIAQQSVTMAMSGPPEKKQVLFQRAKFY